MVLDFYYIPGSAPCRAVQMTAKAVGVDLNLKLTNLMAGEHLKPEYIKVISKKKKCRKLGWNTSLTLEYFVFFS